MIPARGHRSVPPEERRELYEWAAGRPDLLTSGICLALSYAELAQYGASSSDWPVYYPELEFLRPIWAEVSGTPAALRYPNALHYGWWFQVQDPEALEVRLLLLAMMITLTEEVTE